MDAQLLTKIQELIQQGEKLVPEGGLEFSGYNAKMQSQYLTWRKSCLDVIAKLGDKGTTFRERIIKDENGAYFYQTSAQKVLESIKQSLPIVETEVKKNSVAPAPAAPPPAPKPVTKPEPQKVEQPKVEPVKTEQEPAPTPQKTEPPKVSTPPPPAPKPAPAPQKSASVGKNVLVLSSSETELQSQLNSLLKEIGIDAVLFQRGNAPDAIVSFLEKNADAKFAFYLFTAEDINSAMFELGYLVGKVGANRVCCIHQKDDAPPKGIPGISYKEIVVKLEEISFSLIKDLRAAGYTVSI